MKLTRIPTTLRTSKAGFSLIEMAIVFGVISAMLGGIAYGYQKVRDNNRLRMAQSELTAIANNVRTIYTERDTISGTEFNVTLAMDKMHVFPVEMRSSTPGIVYNPWSLVAGNDGSGNPVVGSAAVAPGGYTQYCNGVYDGNGPTQCVAIRFYHVPMSACVQMLYATASQNNLPPGMLEVQTYGGDPRYSSSNLCGTAGCYAQTDFFPVTLDSAYTICQRGASGKLVDMVWFYSLQ